MVLSPPPPAQLIQPSLPFADEDFFPQVGDIQPAAPLLKTSSLQDLIVKLPGDIYFVDKVLPVLENKFSQNTQFPPDYFCALYQLVSSAGPFYPEGTPNYLGARIPLQHTGLNLEMWRKHLTGYECAEICQFLEYGFPLGLHQDHVLEGTNRNHGSAYQYFTWIDEFVNKYLGGSYV